MLGFAARTIWLNVAPRLAPAVVERAQKRRLERLVRTAVTRAPHYADKYRGIDLDKFALADLPPSNKAELMADFDRTVTDPAVRRDDLGRFVDDPANEGQYYLGRYAASHTSGSQGQPMLMVQPKRVIELFFGMQMTRGTTSRSDPFSAASRLVNRMRLAVVTLKRGFYPSASAFTYMPPAARGFVDVLWLSHTDPDVIDRLNAFRPNILTAYAGVLEELALEAQAGHLRLAPHLKQLTNNSEALTDRALQRIESSFGIRPLNNYATGECPFLTNGCPTDQGAHVNSDWAILEVVDENYRPVAPGIQGRKVLITNLANTIQPIIRYEIGDLVTMAAAPCVCGNRLPRVESIQGRTADTFWVEDGGRYRQMISSLFKNSFDYTREVREWQAEQFERNRVRVRLEILPGAEFDLPRAQGMLDRQMEMYGFRGLVDVKLEVVPKLAADPKTGKFRRVVSLVGPPPDLEQRLGASAQPTELVAGNSHGAIRPAGPRSTSRAGHPASAPTR